MDKTEIKAWPRRMVTIPEYGWEIVFFDPTAGELIQIDEARTAKDMGKVKEVVAGLIEKWDCVDRKNETLPIEAASFNKLPPIVQGSILKGLIETQKSADPKEDTASSPATQQGTEPEHAEKSQESDALPE